MKIFKLILLITLINFALNILAASPITENQTPTSYVMKWNETGRNGGTVNGVFSGPMKDGKRNGRWTADIKFHLFGDENFRSGTITMVRNYTNGIPDGPFSFNYDLNWRDGTYNPYQGKWVYGAPSGNKESVSGAFKMGRPDGVWSMKSDRKLGYECNMTFKNGIPVGKRVYWDGINGNVSETYDNDGLLIGYVENGEGWKYKDGIEIPMEIKKKGTRRPFFLLDGEDDNGYFAHAGELYSWLKSYPYGSSDETIEFDMYKVNDNDDLDFLEFVGSPEYIEKSMAALAVRKESKTLNEVCNELNHIEDIYSQRINDYKRKAPEYRNQDFSSLYMAKCNRHLLDSLSPMLNTIEEMPLIKEVMAGKDGNLVDLIRKHLNNFRELNQMNSPDNIEKIEARVATFLRNGRRICEEMNLDPSLFTDEEIEKYYNGQKIILTNMSFHLENSQTNSYAQKDEIKRSISLKRLMLDREKEEAYEPNQKLIDKLNEEVTALESEYADMVAMGDCYIKLDNVNEWVKYVNRKGVRQISSPADITFRDFVLYVAPRGLEKPKKDNWPSEEKMIEAMNAVRRIIPECISLSKVTRNVTLYNSSGFAYDVRKEPLSALDEKKLNKLWKEYAKHYNIPLPK